MVITNNYQREQKCSLFLFCSFKLIHLLCTTMNTYSSSSLESGVTQRNIDSILSKGLERSAIALCNWETLQKDQGLYGETAHLVRFTILVSNPIMNSDSCRNIEIHFEGWINRAGVYTELQTNGKIGLGYNIDNYYTSTITASCTEANGEEVSHEYSFEEHFGSDHTTPTLFLKLLNRALAESNPLWEV